MIPQGLRSTTAILTLLIGMTGPAMAQNLRWTPGGTDGGSGTWDGDTETFTDTGAMPPEATQFTSGADVTFGGIAGTVDVDRGSVGDGTRVGSLTFEIGDYELTGSDLSSFGSGLALISHAGNTTINNDLAGAFATAGTGGSAGTLFLFGDNMGLDSLVIGADSRVRATSLGGNVTIQADGIGAFSGTGADRITVTGGRLDLAAGRALSVVEAVTAGGGPGGTVGVIEVAGDLTAAAVSVGPNGRLDALSTGTIVADIESAGSLNLADAVGGAAGVTGNVTTTAGDADLSGDIDGDLTLGAGTTVTQSGAVDVSGTLDNRTTLETTADFGIGAGINSGDLTVGAGILTVNGLGSSDPTAIVNSGTITVDATLAGSVNGGTIVVSSGGLVDGDLRTVNGTITLEGTADDTLDVTGNVTVGTGPGGTAGTGNLQGDIGGDLRLRSGTTVTQTGELDVRGTLENGTTLVTTAGLDIGAGINSGDLTVNAGTLTVNGLGGADPTAIVNSGSVTVNTTLDGSVDGGDITVGALGVVDGDLRTAGGTLTLGGATDGVIDVTGDVTVAAGTGNLQGDIGGSVVLGAGTAVTQTGALDIDGRLTNGTSLVTTADIAAGSVVTTGTLDVAAGTLTIDGTEPGGGPSVLRNDGTLTVRTEVVGAVVNNGAATIIEGGTVSGSVASRGTGAELTVAGTIDGDLSNTDESDATLGGATDAGASVTGNLTNSGTVTALTSAGGTNLIGGQLLNQQDGTFTTTNNVTVGETVTNAGTLDIAGGRFVVTGTGGVTSTGALTVAQGAVLDSAVVSGGTALDPATVSVAGRVNGAVTNNANSTFTLGGATDDGGTVTGLLTNSGTANFVTSATGTNVVVGGLRNEGGTATVAGNLTAETFNAGELVLDGAAATTLTGDVNNSGTVRATGLLSTLDGRLAGGGTLEVASGSALAVTGGTVIRSGGLLDLGGTLTSDVDVRNMGRAVIDGTLTGGLLSLGRVELDGSVSGAVDLAGGTATLAGDIGGPLTVRGTAAAATDGDLAVTGALSNDATFTVGTGTTTSVTGTVTNTGTFTIEAATGGGTPGTLAGDATGVFDNDGTLTVDGTATGFLGLDNDAAGSLSVGTDGVLGFGVVSRGAADIDGSVTGQFLNSGASGIATIGGDITSGVTNSDAGSVTFDGTSAVGGAGVANSAIMSVTGTLTTALVDNTGAGNLDVTGRVEGSVDSAAILALSGTVTQNVAITGGSASLGGTVGGDLTATAGSLSQGSDLTVGGTLGLSGVTFATGADVDAGTVANAGTLTVSTGDTLTVTGPAGVLDNTGRLTVAGSVVGAIESTGTLVLADVVGGPVGVTGSVTATAGTAALQGDVTGDVTLGAGVTATQTADLAVSGTLDTATTLTTGGDISAGAVANAGTFTVAAGDALTVAGGAGLVTNTGGMIVDGSVVGNVTTSNTFALRSGTPAGGLSGDLTVTAGTASARGTIGGDLNLQGGTFSQTGALVVGGTFDNDATFTTGSPLSVGAVDNSGLLTVAGATTLTVGGGTGLAQNSGTLLVNGSLLGDIGSTGALVLRGNVSRDVTVTAGTVSLGGSVGRDVTLSGGTADQGAAFTVGGTLDLGVDLTTTANVTAAQVDSSANLTVSDGTVLTISDPAGSVANTGAMTLAGTVDGDLTSGGTGAALAMTGKVTGGLAVTGGTATLAGTVGETLTLSGPSATQTGDLTVGGTVTNRADLTVAAGTTLAAPLVLNTTQGDLTLNGTVAANLQSTGALAMGAASAIVGDLTVSDGTASLRSRIDGDATLEGAALVDQTGALMVTGTLTNDTDAETLLDFDVMAGAIANTGALGLASTVSGPLGAQITITNSGTLAMRPTAAVTGSVETSGVMSAAGSITNTLRVTGGTTSTDGDLAVGGATVVGADGTLVVDDRLTTPQVSNAGTFDLNGTLAGGLENVGTTTLAGTVTGAIASSGTLTVDGDSSAGSTATSGTFEIEDGATFGSSLVVTAGTATIDGTLDGTLANRAATVVSGSVLRNVTNAEEARLDVLAGGTLGDGDDVVTSFGTLTLTDGDIDGDLNTGTASTTQVSGNADISGTTTQRGTFTVNDGAVLGGGRFVNFGTLATAGTITNAFSNGGTVVAADGARFTGSFIQAGLVQAEGDLFLDGGARFDAGSVTDLRNGATSPLGDYSGVIVNGPLVGDGGVLAFNLDVREGAGGGAAGDFGNYLQVRGGAITGALTLDFTLLGAPGALDNRGILVIDADATQANDYALGVSGLEPFGALVYIIEERDSDRFVTSAVNPAIGGLPGSIGLTQSLIGQVVNRPSSPFVSALVTPEGNACGTGLWTRAIGGYANATGGVTGTAGDFENDLEATYAGFQAGGDFGCFDGRYAGFDIAVGGIAGHTLGTVTQDIFGFDPVSGEIDTSAVTARIENEFGQSYAGLYISAARGPFVADLQYRLEQTSFDLGTTSLSPGGGIGVRDQSFDSSGQTLSGSLSYARSFGPEGAGFAFGATTGFSLSKTSTDDVLFAGDARLELDDTTSQIGFVGGAVTRTKIAANERSALTVFGTGTYYGDFSDSIDATFFDGFGNNETVTVDPIGSYSELSLGMNYVRILNKGQIGPARQLTGSVRVDGRISDQLESVGLTAQVRLQF